MAKKELLFSLILGWVVTCSAPAFADFDRDSVMSLVKTSRAWSIKAIKEKYAELQEMLKNKDDQGTQLQMTDIFGDSPNLRVFVSSSMSRELLKAYVTEAKKYKAVLVFNGLPNGSWRELSAIVSEIADSDDEVGIQVDDEAFKRFEIKSVPSFVLSLDNRDAWQSENEGDDFRANVYDKASGNIGIGGFLRLVANEGDLAVEARRLLE